MIAKTAASGGSGLHPDVLAFTSSLPLDRTLWREDIVGSLAHLTMLARTGVIPRADAVALRRGLSTLWRSGEGSGLALPDEEDVHMAIEGALALSVGPPSALLHTARSRNDQVALDLRLHVREQCAAILDLLADWVTLLAERADAEMDTLLPGYTHRQRAQPIRLSFWLAAYGEMFVRDLEAFRFVLGQTDAMPLGVGALAGTTLPIDRHLTRSLLGFRRLTANGLDTVGDRDFALDFAYAAARFFVHASRLSTDLVDFCSAEFGFAKLSGELACGSSMMPQKRNPDVFELIRGKSGRATGNLVALLTTLKGLPGGYNRDLQEDRGPLLETGPMVRGTVAILSVALPRVTFDRDRCRAALEEDYTQATDLAEALVARGTPFRDAYQAVGALVLRCQQDRLPLAKVTLEMARDISDHFDQHVLDAARLALSPDRRSGPGGTGAAPVREHLSALRQAASDAHATARDVPRLGALFKTLEEAAL